MKTAFWMQLHAAAKKVVHQLKRIVADGKIFRVEDKPWRWKGVTAFGLMSRFAKGEDITPFLDAFEGFNLLRVFWYVTWPGTGWEPADLDTIRRFLEFVGARGFYVELVLLTDDDPVKLRAAIELVNSLRNNPPDNLVLEIGNEPKIHKDIHTELLRGICEASGFLHASGDNETPEGNFGGYLTAHTPRDGDWPRKGHDLMEYYGGGGPATSSDPPHHKPCVADEPAKLEDVGGENARDWRAYFGVCSLLGAGATFHFENGKYGLPPNDAERRMAAAALEGLDAFPPEAPLGPYSRPEDSTLRTYVVGHYMVRVRPTSLEGVVPGTMLDKDGILWKL